MRYTTETLRRVGSCSLVALAVAMSASAALAASGTTVANGNWTTNATWNASPYPQVYSSGGTGSGDSATINGGFNVAYNATSGTTSVFATTINGGGALNISGGNLTIGGRLSLNGSGALNLSSGILNIQGVGTSGDQDSPSTNSRALRLGYGGAATITQTGGLFNYTIVNDFADYAPSTGTPGAVTFNITGGTFQTTATNIELGGNASGSVVAWNLGGGAGAALFDQTSGTGGYFSKGGKATVTLNTNGTLSIFGFNLGNGGTSDSAFNFDGGTLKARAGNDLLPSSIFSGGGTRASVFIKENGAILDSNSFSPSISAVLNHGGVAATDGGVTKVGTGTFTLSGAAANTYTGVTTVNVGTLQLNKTAGVNAIGGNLVIGDGTGTDAVKLLAANQIPAVDVTINSSGVLDLNGNGESIARLLGSGVVDNTTATALTFVVASNTDAAFSGNITQSGGGVVTVEKQNANTITFTGTGSTFTGELRVNAGTLVFDNSGALGAGTAIRLGNASTGGGASTLRYVASGTNPTNLSARTITINKTDGPYTSTITNDSVSTAATLTIGNITTAGSNFITKSLVLNGSNTGDNTVSGVIADGALTSPNGLSVTKSGAGTWILSNANTYTGGTTVNGGTLKVANVTGSATGAGSVTVQTGATLGGTGTVSGAVDIQLGGHLAPGNSIGTMGAGPLTISGIYDVELGTPGTSHAAPGLADLTNVTGNLTLGGTLNLINNAGADGNGSVGAGSYKILTYTGTNSGSFSSITGPSATLHAKVVDDGANSSGGTDGVFLDVYRLASANAHTPEPINFGTVLTGTPLSQNLSLTNSAANDGFSERLNASIGSPTGSATTNLGGFSLLVPGGTNNSSLAAGINTSTAGSKSGTATITLASDGTGTSGFGTTALTSQTVNLSATVLDPAAASFTSPAAMSVLNLDLGTFNQNTGLHSTNFDIYNLMQTLGFTANLDLDSFTLVGLDNPNLSTNLSLFSNLSPGGNQTFAATLSTANIGAFSETYQLQLSSNGFLDPSQTLTLNLSGAVLAVPEPASVAVWTLIGLATAAGAWRLRRRQA